MFGYFLALGIVYAVSAHPYYADLLPNGHSVPRPFLLAVGHYDPIHHTHYKNPFGMAFAQAGHTWTSAFCALDSDADGKTNGKGLGDPTCVWTQKTTPTCAATGHRVSQPHIILFDKKTHHIENSQLQ